MNNKNTKKYFLYYWNTPLAANLMQIWPKYQKSTLKIYANKMPKR